MPIVGAGPIYLGSQLVGQAEGPGGTLAFMQPVFTTSMAFTANVFVACSLWVPADITINRLGCYIGTSSGNLCLAVYADSGGVPGSRLATTGSVASPGTGKRTFAIADTVIPAGIVWAGAVADNESLNFAVGVPSGTIMTFNGSSLVQPLQRSSSFPPDDPLGSGTSTVNVAPVIWGEYVAP